MAVAMSIMLSTFVLSLILSSLVSSTNDQLIPRLSTSRRHLLPATDIKIKDQSTGCYLAFGHGPIDTENFGYDVNEFDVFYDCDDHGTVWLYDGHKFILSTGINSELQLNPFEHTGHDVLFGQYNAKISAVITSRTRMILLDELLYTMFHDTQCVLQHSGTGASSYDKWTPSGTFKRVTGFEAIFNCNHEAVPAKFTILSHVGAPFVIQAPIAATCAINDTYIRTKILAHCDPGYEEVGPGVCYDICIIGYEPLINAVGTCIQQQCNPGYTKVPPYQCRAPQMCNPRKLLPTICGYMYDYLDTYHREATNTKCVPGYSKWGWECLKDCDDGYIITPGLPTCTCDINIFAMESINFVNKLKIDIAAAITDIKAALQPILNWDPATLKTKFEESHDKVLHFMNPYVLYIKKFVYNLVPHNNVILSLEIQAFSNYGVSGAAGFGIAFDIKNNKRYYYLTGCVGAGSDIISNGISVSLGFNYGVNAFDGIIGKSIVLGWEFFEIEFSISLAEDTKVVSGFGFGISGAETLLAVEIPFPIPSSTQICTTQNIYPLY